MAKMIRRGVAFLAFLAFLLAFTAYIMNRSMGWALLLGCAFGGLLAIQRVRREYEIDE